MWKVKCDDNLLFLSNNDRLKIFNPKLELELNKVGAFTFTIYPSHPYYSKVQKLTSIIKVYWDDYLIFKGRVLDDTKSVHNEKHVDCEGVLAYFIDSKQDPYDFQSGENHTDIKPFLEYLVGVHNDKVCKTLIIDGVKLKIGEEKTFKVGTVSVSDPNNYIVRSDSTYLSTWESLNQKLIDTNGGYLWVREEIEIDEKGKEKEVNYLDYVSDFNTISNQSIEFGKNLLDFNEITKGSVIATAIIPIGADGLTIEEVNDGKNYVYNAEAVKKYGWIEVKVDWNDVTDPNNLKAKAEEYLSDSINLYVSLELTAIDLSALNKDFNSFRLGTYVPVKSKPHGVSSNFLVTKLSIDLLKPSNNKLVLGKTYKTFTEKTYANTFKQNQEVVNIVQNGVTKAQLNDRVLETEEKTSTSISQSADEILLQVAQYYTLKDELNTLIESVKTEFAQNNEGFEMRFSQFILDLEDLANGTNAQFQEINKYIKFIDGKILLGEEGNELTLNISNDRISFLQDNVEVAYFSNKKLYVTHGEFINQLKVGNFGFTPEEDGSLTFGKLD